MCVILDASLIASWEFKVEDTVVSQSFEPLKFDRPSGVLGRFDYLTCLSKSVRPKRLSWHHRKCCVTWLECFEPSCLTDSLVVADKPMTPCT